MNDRIPNSDSDSPVANWILARSEVSSALTELERSGGDIDRATTCLRQAWSRVFRTTEGIPPDGASAESDPQPDPVAFAKAWIETQRPGIPSPELEALSSVFAPVPLHDPVPLDALRVHARWLEERIIEHLEQRRGLGIGGLLIIATTVVGLLLAVFVFDVSGPAPPWRAEYFKNEEFDGKPVVEYVADVDFAWADEGPHPKIPKDGFSARFQTCLVVKDATKYRFRLTSDDGSRLFVDGDQIVDNWGAHGKRTRGGSVELEEGRHLVEIEYFDRRYGAHVHLEARTDDDDDYAELPWGSLRRPSPKSTPCR